MARFDLLKQNKQVGRPAPVSSTEAMVTAKAQRRRQNPDYKQFSAYVPTALYRRLKGYLATNEIELSEAVEQALSDWIEKRGGA